MTTGHQPEAGELEVFFLAQGEQRAQDVAARLAAFIGAAQHSLDIAIYNFHLSDPLKAIVGAALDERAAAGVAIRIAFDGDTPSTPHWDAGMDPPAGDTDAFVQSLGHPYRRIGGMKLMHHKYVLRDAATAAARVWTGSTNMTDDSWSLQENNIVVLASPALARYYTQDFEEMWRSGTIENSGVFEPPAVQLAYGGEPATVQVLFSPGRGPVIDYDVAHRVACAHRRVRICSMLLNSSALLAALNDVLRYGQAEVSGIYDRTQMESVLDQWQNVPHNHWKIGAVRNVIQHAHLVGKISTPYGPDRPHDYMHNKVLVVDDTVITGSYNFSHSAELNAENIVMIDSRALSQTYSQYIDHVSTVLSNRDE